MSTAVVLFRRDLRLADNPALTAARAAHARVLPVYIHSSGDDEGEWRAGGASRWWLHHSLAALDARLRAGHAALHLRCGDTLQQLRDIIAQSGASAVYWNRLYEPASMARDTRIKSVLSNEDIAVHSYNAALWCEPWRITTLQGGPYKLFTPYWRNLRAKLQVTAPLPAPTWQGWHEVAGALPLAALDLLPRFGWDSGLANAWQPGESGAQQMLDVFATEALVNYAQGRDVPARHGTSRLSPHLHFGEISPQQIHARLHDLCQQRGARERPDLEPYLRQLGWREFAHHLLFHFPQTPTENFNPRFADFDWAPPDDAQLARWQQGRTGIPLVDAGMRELWQTGWMHNRVRMIAASFLAKNLRQHWLQGAGWFWNTLVDADLANNTLGWQWVAGCGADAAPYFRVFNPVTQARRFDPDGVYLKRWLPELVDAPTSQLHEPWKYPSLLKRTGYPAPMIDMSISRRLALEAYSARR